MRSVFGALLNVPATALQSTQPKSAGYDEINQKFFLNLAAWTPKMGQMSYFRLCEKIQS